MILKILLVVGFLFIFAILALIIIRIRDGRKVDTIWQSLETQPVNEVFSEQMVSDLPAPARRYFLHAIQPGTPLASSVILKMRGEMRLKPDAEWMPIEADEILSMPKGFVWKASVGSGLLRLSGADYYANRVGRVRFGLWGIVPLVNQTGPDVTRSSIGRFACEMIWLPSSLLPRRGVMWYAVDEEYAKATMKIDDETITMTLQVEPDGKLRQMVLSRWGDKTPDGSLSYIPFGGAMKAERSFGGYTIPSEVACGWWFGTDRYFEFFRAQVEGAIFR
ncbi:MAG: hypothetical protein MOB07_20175 [Acidobacteria bacterium]|nr:hypothetical protein [Acidobacteriota bacterium]